MGVTKLELSSRMGIFSFFEECSHSAVAGMFRSKQTGIGFTPIRAVSEKAVAPHSSTLAWKIPWMEEPGRLRSMGSLKVGQD